MEENAFARECKEIYVLLQALPVEDVEKIPENIREMFKENMDISYNFSIDMEKTFEEQNFMSGTKAIIANLFRDYWATEYQKERIIAKQNSDRNKLEQEKREKYNPDDIFKNHIQHQKAEANNETAMVEYKENIFRRIISKIKNMFIKR